MNQILTLLQIQIIIRSLKSDVYIVGGAVRDNLLGNLTKDIDLVTSADYDTMSAAFKLAGWSVKETGKQYLVLNISKRGQHFELSNFRMDTDNSGGRIGTINTDSNRRDFTINALYTTLDYKAILDPTGQGLQDIKTRTLRFIGKPKNRIEEDPLRVYRFYRLLHTKNLVPHPASLRAVRQLFNYATSTVAPERVRSELERTIGL